MTAGRLRESIALSAFEGGGEDEYGNPIDGGWTEKAIVPARIVGMKGSESVVAGRLQGIQPWIITIRHAGAAATVTTDWKATNTRTGVDYNIRSIITDERGAYTDLLCESGVAI